MATLLSSRLGTAAGAAAAIGTITFSIWWVTTPRQPGPTGPGPRTEAAAKEGAPRSRLAEPAIPRGGSLRGSIRQADELEAIRLLTEAPLVRINRSTDQVEPWLAESWTTSSDNRSYSFKLRPNILWSDGRPLVAADVVAALAASDAPARVVGKPLTVRAAGPLQVDVTFPEPFAPALRLLANVPIRAPNAGLGPFRLRASGASARQAEADQLAFVRNPRYWRKAPDGKPLPYLDGLVLTFIPDQNAELQQLLGGQLDFIQGNIRPEDDAALQRADETGKIRLYDLEAGFDADALWFSPSPAASANKQPNRWLAQDDFRLAISAAVDRRKFCDTVYLGACDPVWGSITPGNPAWFNPDLPAVGPDQKLARAMLAGLGLQDRNADGTLDDERGNPVRVAILVASNEPRDGMAARFVRDELGKVGIGVEVAAIEPGVLNARRLKGDYDAIYSRWVPDDTDPAMNPGFWLQWASTGNAWGTQVADLMRRQAATTDRVQRVQLFADAQKIYVQHMPAVFFGAPYAYVATSTRVLNARPSRRQPSLLWNADMLAAIAR